MSNDTKRMVMFVAFTLLWVLGISMFGERLGLVPKPKPRPAVPAPAVVADADPKPGDVAKDAPAPAAAAPAAAPVAAKVEPVPSDELVLGSLDSDSGYHLRARLAQEGAGVEVLELSRHMAERERKGKPRRPLKLIPPDPDTVPSFGLNLARLDNRADVGEADRPEIRLDNLRWEAVRDERGRVVRPLVDPKAGGQEQGQEVVFRTAVGDPPVTITKTFRLRKGVDGLELGLKFESPKAERRLAYLLGGPHGVPIEGEWYTSIFREVFFGLAKGETTQVETRAASDIVAKAATPEVFTTLPLRYVGVENQYFAVFLAPDPATVNPKDRIDDQTEGVVVRENPKEKQKSDVSVVMTSRPIEVGPNRPVTQEFRIYAGPKATDALAKFGAQDLAAYRKGWFTIPYASTLAQNVIAPLLDRIYGLTLAVSRAFGGTIGNYGIAIILLTVTVRLLLFPLSRKQAISAKKMTDLQPRLTELKEKYKDDKEAITRETFALYKKAGVNPLGGCVLGLIQLPIFVGLWQALNNSVALRHASFLWIDDLAAPDMMFRFPTTLPILGDYFNLLPFAVVGLMLVQMKLFTPPATTPDQEMSQKMMKFMMVFMSFMFYKVPSGLGLYFITSSTWAICERLLLPKMVKVRPIEVEPEAGDGRPRRPPGLNGGPNGNGNGNGNPPVPGGFRDKLRQIIEEASKDRTIRNVENELPKGNRPRPRPGKRK